jgi:hypothetical protein
VAKTNLLATIQRLGHADRFTYETGDIIHALAGPGLVREDLRSALAHATTCVPYAPVDGTWLVSGGHDTDGTPLRIVVRVFDASLAIVTFDCVP